MIHYPLKYEVKATATPGIASLWTCQSERLKPIDCSIAPEFGGSGKGYCASELLGMALLNCMISMFKSYSEKFSVNFKEISGTAVIKFDKDSVSNQLMISSLEASFKVTGAEDPDKVRQTLEKALADCPVSHSIKSAKMFHIDVLT